jgi:hypothetical protein
LGTLARRERHLAHSASRRHGQVAAGKALLAKQAREPSRRY